MQTEARFWAKVDRRGPDECWSWLGAVACKEKYGRFYVGGRMVPAHRKAWELAKEGIHMDDHGCWCNPTVFDYSDGKVTHE